MRKSCANETELQKNFIPGVCASEYDVIIEACGAMPSGMFHTFVMWYMDEMEISDIALAMDAPEEGIRAQIRRGQMRILAALGYENGRVAASENVSGQSEGPSLVARALDQFLLRAFSAETLSNIVDRSIAAAKAAKPAVVKPVPVPVSIPRAEPRKKSRRAGFLSAAAALIFTFKSSMTAQAAALATTGVLVLSGCAFYYYSLVPAPDQSPVMPAPAPVGVVEQTIQPEVKTQPLQNMTAAQAATTPTSAAVSPAPGESVQYMIPSAQSPEPTRPTTPAPSKPTTPPDPADGTYIPPAAYTEAVDHGVITLTGRDCVCGHVNPPTAQVSHMNADYGTVTWTISSEDGETVLYHGGGQIIEGELRQLFEVQGDGEYLITFTYNLSDGLSVTKSRPITIDRGTITENEYE